MPAVLASAGAAPPQPSTLPATPDFLRAWLWAQGANAHRHAEALRPFRREEFGGGGQVPSEGHIQAANRLISDLRVGLNRMVSSLERSVQSAKESLATPELQRLVRVKERTHNRVQSIERIWDFYFELFGQRQSQFGNWLVGCDRIALDCYQHAYLGLGVARSIPAPPPFSYMRTGFSPATFRRGIPLRRIGRRLNPFPLIQLPYHRMVNPWTLGAVLHEVGHNLHNDLGLARAVPLAIARRLLSAGIPVDVARIWVRTNREVFADMIGTLLGGPAIVGSLMDVVGRSPEFVYTYVPRKPHPVPYLRALISTELLRRMGFPSHSAKYAAAWRRLYPDPRRGNIPSALLDTFPRAVAIVVDTICYQPYPSLGNKCLSDVVRFAPKEQQMVEEAARRLAAGTDPGVVPERFLIGAARVALHRRWASPAVIATNFYNELGRR
jgi:hypothetical protein